MNFRIGFGYDVHQLKAGYDLVVGGIKIPNQKGSVGHSDADVLIHAICDALLGAADMRDIGHHFPDTDPLYRGIDSKILLEKVVALIREEGYEVGNIDSTICLQRPKLKLYIDQMKEVLASVLSIKKNQISVKATTTEKLGFTGREEGISAYAVVLIHK